MSKVEVLPQDSEDIDSEVLEEAQKVDWHSVSEPEAVSFGLAMGYHREAQQQYVQRRVAFYTVFGGVINIAVMSIVGVVLLHDTIVALGGIACSQLGRLGWLWWKQKQSERAAEAIFQQALDVTKQLAQFHPL